VRQNISYKNGKSKGKKSKQTYFLKIAKPITETYFRKLVSDLICELVCDLICDLICDFYKVSLFLVDANL